MSKGYLHIDLEWLSAMTLTEVAVYGWLMGWSKHTKGPVSATYGDIATALSMSERTVKVIMKRLVEKELVSVERNKKNSYKVKSAKSALLESAKSAQDKCKICTFESAESAQHTLLNINKSIGRSIAGTPAGTPACIINNVLPEKQEPPDSPSWPPERVITNPEYWKNATIEGWMIFFKKRYNTSWKNTEPQVNALRDLSANLRELIEQRIGMVDYQGAVRHISDWFSLAYSKADSYQKSNFEPRLINSQFNSLNIKTFNNGTDNTNTNDRSSGSNISAGYLADIISKIDGAGV